MKVRCVSNVLAAGQAMTEYLVGLLLVVLVLILPLGSEDPVVVLLLKIVLARLRTFGFLIALP
jgi:hypothetical protein